MMTLISPREVELSGLQRSQVIAYAKNHGWQEIDHPQKQLLVLAGPPDDDGEPLLMVLPSKDGGRRLPLRLAEAVNLLAGVEDRSPYDVLKEIQEKSLLIAIANKIRGAYRKPQISLL